MFPSARLHHLASSASDHCCLMLRTSQRSQRRKSKKLFRFESMWLKDGRCGDIVKESWAEGELTGRGNIFSSFMDRCKETLIKWNMQEFGHIGKKTSQGSRVTSSFGGKIDGAVKHLGGMQTKGGGQSFVGFGGANVEAKVL